MILSAGVTHGAVLESLELRGRSILGSKSRIEGTRGSDDRRGPALDDRSSDPDQKKIARTPWVGIFFLHILMRGW